MQATLQHFGAALRGHVAAATGAAAAGLAAAGVEIGLAPVSHQLAALIPHTLQQHWILAPRFVAAKRNAARAGFGLASVSEAHFATHVADCHRLLRRQPPPQTRSSGQF